MRLREEGNDALAESVEDLHTHGIDRRRLSHQVFTGCYATAR